MLAQKSLLKHFRRYADDLLFISVATEVKSASIICQYLIGEEREVEERFELVLHEKQINSTKVMICFVSPMCNFLKRWA